MGMFLIPSRIKFLRSGHLVPTLTAFFSHGPGGLITLSVRIILTIIRKGLRGSWPVAS